VIFTAVFGIIDNGPESLRPMWPAIVKVEFLNPTGVKWSIFARTSIRAPTPIRRRKTGAGSSATNDVEFSTDGKTDVRCGLRRAVRQLPDGIAVLHDA
jgi:hypothetical protein